MKNILESPETFNCYAQIDYCYFAIEQIRKGFEKPKRPIEILIDRATGFTLHQSKETRKVIIELLEELIECKKKIEADYSGDEKTLKELKAMKT